MATHFRNINMNTLQCGISLLLSFLSIALLALGCGVNPFEQTGAEKSAASNEIVYNKKLEPKFLYENNSEILLAQAIIEGDSTSVKTLIEQGVNVNAKGKYNITPLFLAIQFDRLDIFQLLLDHAASADTSIDYSDSTVQRYKLIASSAILIAANDLNPEYITRLLKKGVNPNRIPGLLESPFRAFLELTPGMCRRGVISEQFRTPYPSYSELVIITDRKLDAFLNAGADVKTRLPNGDSILALCFTDFWYEGKDSQFRCVKKLLEHNTPLCGSFLMRYTRYFNEPSILDKRGKEAQKDFEQLNNVLFASYNGMRDDFQELCRKQKRLAGNIGDEERNQIYENIIQLGDSISEKYNHALK